MGALRDWAQTHNMLGLSDPQIRDAFVGEAKRLGDELDVRLRRNEAVHAGMDPTAAELAPQEPPKDTGGGGAKEPPARPRNRRAATAAASRGCKPTRPTAETDTFDPRGTRRSHATEQELRAGVAEALKAAHDSAKKVPRAQFDQLLEHLKQTDPAFAKDVELLLREAQRPQFLEAAIVELWKRARDNQRTVAEELEHSLGGAVNAFDNTPGLKGLDAIAEFGRALSHPRPMLDVSFASQPHGTHTHMFEQYLGDLLLGKGGGLAFRQKLVELTGPSETIFKGQADEFEKPYWSRLWDEMFDANDARLSNPDVLGGILQDHADFPRKPYREEP